MKKKILLLALSLTLLLSLPTMAFAATGSGSAISVEDASAYANGTDSLEFILDLDEDLADDQIIAVFAERNGSLSDVDYLTENVGMPKEEPGYIIFDNTGINGGENVIYVSSTALGTVTLKAYVINGDNLLEKTVAELYNGTEYVEGEEFYKVALVGNGCTGKFISASSDMTAEISVKSSNGVVSGGDNNVYSGASANNGVDYYDVAMMFMKGGSELVGEDVTISLDKVGATLSKTEVVTSENGTIDFKVSAAKPGSYHVFVECGTFSEQFTFIFNVSEITGVNFVYTTPNTIAVDTTETLAMEIAATDIFGNKLKANDSIVYEINSNFNIEVISAPSGSLLENEFLECQYNANVSENVYISFTPDKAGSYTIKAYNKTTGLADTTTINAAEFGAVDHAAITYPANVYSFGNTTPAATVYLYDANGVKKQATRKMFSFTGDGVADFNETNGQITFYGEPSYVGEKVEVMVVADGEYAAKTTLTIMDKPLTLEFAQTNVKAGEEAMVQMQVLDKQGNKTAISSAANYDVDLQSVIVIEKPAGAMVGVDCEYLLECVSNLLKKGTGKISISSNVEGTVKANVALKLTANVDMTVNGILYKADTNPYAFYLTGTATAVFGESGSEINPPEGEISLTGNITSSGSEGKIYLSLVNSDTGYSYAVTVIGGEDSAIAYSFENIQAGNYTLTAVKDKHISYIQEIALTENATEDITLYSQGDFNKDNKVSAMDMQYFYQYLIGNQEL